MTLIFGNDFAQSVAPLRILAGGALLVFSTWILHAAAISTNLDRRLLLTTLAPHLVRPVPFLFPLRHRVWERPYLGAGLLLYDTMGGARHVPRSQHLSKRAALRSEAGAMRAKVEMLTAAEERARRLAQEIEELRGENEFLNQELARVSSPRSSPPPPLPKAPGA